MPQLTRSSVHLIVQQLFPRTQVQLRASSTCHIRGVSVELRVILAIVAEVNLSAPCDQMHTAHPHVHNSMHTMRIHCVDGCIATRPYHNNPMQVCDDKTGIFLKNWAQPRRMANGIIMSNRRVATCMPHEVRAHMQKK